MEASVLWFIDPGLFEGFGLFFRSLRFQILLHQLIYLRMFFLHMKVALLFILGAEVAVDADMFDGNLLSHGDEKLWDGKRWSVRSKVVQQTDEWTDIAVLFIPEINTCVHIAWQNTTTLLRFFWPGPLLYLNPKLL